MLVAVISVKFDKDFRQRMKMITKEVVVQYVLHGSTANLCGDDFDFQLVDQESVCLADFLEDSGHD